MKPNTWHWSCPCGASDPKERVKADAEDKAQTHDREVHHGERTAVLHSSSGVTQG